MSTVKDILSAPVIGIAPDDSLAQARNLMLRHRVGRLVVIDDDKPIGIVTRKDLAMKLVQAEPEWRRRPIDHIPVKLTMTVDPLTIHPEATVQQAAVLMRDNDISGLLVMDRKLVGLVSKTDLVRFFSKTKNIITVGEMMRPINTSVHLYHSLNHVFETMDEYGVDSIIVMDSEKPIGLVTRDNLAFIDLPSSTRRAEHVWRGNKRAQQTNGNILLTAGDVMYSPITTTTPDESATAAAAMLIEQEFNEMPVTENGDLKGMFTMTVIINHLAEGKP